MARSDRQLAAAVASLQAAHLGRHWKYRPEQARSPYSNVVFAGDWVNGMQPTASIEAATRTGRVAANLLRERSGRYIGW